MMLCFCLLLSINNERNMYNLLRANLLLKSISLYSEKKYDIFIITPEDTSQYIKKYINYYDNINYIFMYDEHLCPNINEYKIDSWWKQQLLKLLISRYINYKFYLLFDSDIICIDRLNDDKFIQNGKAFMQYERASAQYNWYKASAQILNLPPPDLEDQVMSVTPNIISTKLAKNLLDHIEKEKQMPVCEFLLNNTHQDGKQIPWTEYSLFYLYCKNNGLILNEYFGYDPKNSHRFLSPLSLWKRSTLGQLKDLDINKIKNSNSTFLCIQSISKIPVIEIYLKMGSIFYNDKSL